MRNVRLLMMAAILLFLTGCSGSDAYRGAWKATNASGQKFEIVFAAKSFTVKDSSGKTTSYSYTQNGVSIENSVETYRIKLEDGRRCQVNFPVKDEGIGLILDQGGNLLFAISRKDYITYQDIFKL